MPPSRATLRSKGVIHGDVRNNVIVTPQGEPRLVDFGASFVIGGITLPLRGFLVRTAEGYNDRAVLKLKRSLAPALLTPSEEEFLARPLPCGRWVEIGERTLQGAVRTIGRLLGVFHKT